MQSSPHVGTARACCWPRKAAGALPPVAAFTTNTVSIRSPRRGGGVVIVAVVDSALLVLSSPRLADKSLFTSSGRSSDAHRHPPPRAPRAHAASIHGICIFVFSCAVLSRRYRAGGARGEAGGGCQRVAQRGTAVVMGIRGP